MTLQAMNKMCIFMEFFLKGIVNILVWQVCIMIIVLLTYQ